MTQPTAARPSVFLSYAREDDEPFVAALHDRLVRAGIQVWWDRRSMSSRGRSFLQELRDAIDCVDRVIAVIGPHAVRSEYVLVEWRHALLFGTPIVPVLREGRFEDAPREIAKLHGIDMSDDGELDAAVVELVRLLREPVASLGAFVTPVPALPAFFQPREDLLDAMHDELLRDIERPEVVTEAEQVLVLHGMGGVGKSVIAAAFCRLARTRRTVPEGICWIEAGPDAQPVELVRRLARALGAPTSELNDLASARAQLPRLLAGRRCLVVLDDVWDVAAAKPVLNALAPQTRLLLTTRLGDLFPGKPTLSVRPFDASASLRLLSEWSSEPLNKMSHAARSVAERCGGLPFALALCGAMRRDGAVAWADLLEALAEADLAYLEHRFPNYEQYADLLSCLEVSVRALDDALAKSFKELVVLAGAAVIPETAILTLWTRDGEPERKARKRLGNLAAKALVRLEGEPSRRRIVMHSLVGDYLRAAVDLPDQTDLHGQLVEAYAKKCPQGWPSGPHDGYFHANLCRHLAKSERADELRALLQSFPWLRARLAATDPLGLPADYRFLEPDDELQAIAEALRLSLAGLSVDPNELPGQLLGRLSATDTPSARAVCAEARSCDDVCWLEPRIAPLRRPGDPLRYSFDYHQESVYAAAMTPDGLRAVTGDKAGTIVLWDLELGFAVRGMRAHEARVWSLAMEDDGARAVAAYGEHGLLVWRIGDGRVECRAELHGEDLRAVACTGDGMFVVAGLQSGLFAWDLDNDRHAVLRREESDATTDVALSPDGARAVAATSKGAMEVWDVRAPERILRVAASQQTLRSVHFNASGRQVLSLGDDYVVRFWDAATGRELDRWQTDGYLFAAAPRPEAEWAYVGNVDGHLETHALSHPGNHTVVAAHRSPVRAVVTDARATVVLTTADDGAVRVWDGARLVTAAERANHPGSVVDVALRPDGSKLASASTGGTVLLWDTNSPDPPKTYPGHGTTAVRAVALSPNAPTAASSDANGRVAIWNLETLQTEHVLNIHAASVTARRTKEGVNIELAPGGGIYLSFSNDGKRLLAGGADGTFARIELDDIGEGFRFELGEDGPWVHAASGDGRWAASVNDKGAPTFFDVENGSGRRLKGGVDSFVTALSASQDGRLVLCTYSNGALRGWDLTAGPEPLIRAEPRGGGGTAMYDVNTGRRRIVGDERSQFYSDIALTVDTRFGVFATNAGLLLVRELATWTPVASFTCDEELFACAVSADGSWVAAGGQDSVYLFKLNGLHPHQVP
jgi:WD40 repeat protein